MKKIVGLFALLFLLTGCAGNIKTGVAFLEEGKYEEAVELYSMMTNTLVRKYLFSYTVGEELWNKIDSSNAGHGKIKL